MEKFLFIPPVDDSMPPLTAGQWVWLFCSFFASLALLALFGLLIANHIVLAVLCIFAFTFTKIPMQAYAMNRQARWVGRLYLLILAAAIFYFGRNWIERHPFESLTVVFASLAVVWIILSIGQMGNLILTRLEVLQRRANSIESKLDRIERTTRRMEEEGENIQSK